MTVRNAYAFAIAIVVGILLYLVSQGVLGQFIGGGNGRIQILVARSAVQPLQKLDVTTKSLSASQVQALGPNPLTVADEGLLGSAVAAGPIAAGQPILQSMVTSPQTAGTSVVRPSEALYTLETKTLSTPVNGLSAGELVDVTATYRSRPAGQSLTNTGQLAQTGEGLTYTSIVATTLETRVPVSGVTNPGSAPAGVTIVIPRADVGTFDILKALGATFSFAQVGPQAGKTITDRSGNAVRTTGRRNIQDQYNVPTQ